MRNGQVSQDPVELDAAAARSHCGTHTRFHGHAVVRLSAVPFVLSFLASTTGVSVVMAQASTLYVLYLMYYNELDVPNIIVWLFCVGMALSGELSCVLAPLKFSHIWLF